MKNYNKILEAVNRGILLALDDFEDDQVLNVKSKQVLNRDYTKEYLDLLRDEVVDLELPSGTLWCKYNLDVNSNLLSKAEDWYGDYYAWGELEPNKPIYDWNTYKFSEIIRKHTFADIEEQHITKYSEEDDLTRLKLEDDAAYLYMHFYNFKFHIPTKELCEELINYTQSYWVKNYDPNKTIHNPKNDRGIKGLNGRVFVGKNANQLFIPAAGYRISPSVENVDSDCYLWSSNLYLNDSSDAYLLHSDSDQHDVNHNFRCFGFTIRPVIKL